MAGKNLVVWGKRANFVGMENLMPMRCFLSCIFAALLLTGCWRGADEAPQRASAAEAELVLAKAESYAAQGQAEQAYGYAISLTDSGEYEMRPSQICRQALVLYRISNDGEDAERLVAALTCYERALELDADSVEAFVAGLEAADQYDMRFIHDLNMRLNHPQEYAEHERPDSLIYDL